MSQVATGMANNTTASFVKADGSSVLTSAAGLQQRNPGVITSIQLTTPLVIGAPFAPGGTAASMNLALIPVGPAPHSAVNLRLNFYDVDGDLIGVQDIS